MKHWGFKRTKSWKTHPKTWVSGVGSSNLKLGYNFYLRIVIIFLELLWSYRKTKVHFWDPPAASTSSGRSLQLKNQAKKVQNRSFWLIFWVLFQNLSWAAQPAGTIQYFTERVSNTIETSKYTFGDRMSPLRLPADF